MRIPFIGGNKKKKKKSVISDILGKLSKMGRLFNIAKHFLNMLVFLLLVIVVAVVYWAYKDYKDDEIHTEFKNFSNTVQVQEPTVSNQSSQSVGASVQNSRYGEVVGKTDCDGNPVEITRGFVYHQYGGFSEEWADTTFYGDDTFRSAGCGPTAAAMVMSDLLDQEITPLDIFEVVKKGNNWATSDGIAHDFFMSGLPDPDIGYGAQGIKCKHTSDINEVVEALGSTNPRKEVISAQGNGIFTPNSGHIIVLYGLNSEGKIIVKDPNYNQDKKEGRAGDGIPHGKRGFTPEEISSSCQNYWIYWKE